MRRDRKAEIVHRQLELRPGGAGVGRAEDAAMMLHPHRVGRGSAARHAVRVLRLLLARQLRRHIGRDQPVAAQRPACRRRRANPRRRRRRSRRTRGWHRADRARWCGCRHRHSRRRTISRAPARSTARSPGSNARRDRRTRTVRPAARRPTAGPARRRRRPPASRSGTASASPPHRRERPAPAVRSNLRRRRPNDAACCRNGRA